MIRKTIEAPLRDPVQFVKTGAVGKSEMIVGIDLGTREWSAETILDAGGSVVSSRIVHVQPPQSK